MDAILQAIADLLSPTTFVGTVFAGLTVSLLLSLLHRIGRRNSSASDDMKTRLNHLEDENRELRMEIRELNRRIAQLEHRQEVAELAKISANLEELRKEISDIKRLTASERDETLRLPRPDDEE